MWMMTTRGFFSAVQKPGDAKDDMLTVRARAKGDLDNLAELLPAAKPFKEKGFTDYPWRIRVKRSEWAAAVAVMANEIDYSNFKDEVKARQGRKRAEVYGRVWGVLLSLERRAPRSRSLGRDHGSARHLGSLFDRTEDEPGEPLGLARAMEVCGLEADEVCLACGLAAAEDGEMFCASCDKIEKGLAAS